MTIQQLFHEEFIRQPLPKHFSLGNKWRNSCMELLTFNCGYLRHWINKRIEKWSNKLRDFLFYNYLYNSQAFVVRLCRSWFIGSILMWHQRNLAVAAWYDDNTQPVHCEQSIVCFFISTDNSKRIFCWFSWLFFIVHTFLPRHQPLQHCLLCWY